MEVEEEMILEVEEVIVEVEVEELKVRRRRL